MAFKIELCEQAVAAFRSKYVGKINAQLNEFLNQFELEADLTTDFFYDDRENLIGYALASPAEADDEFRQFFESLNPKFYYNDFICGFFHELGHHNTLHTFDEEVLFDYYCHRDAMSSAEYFNHPVELEATLWAIEYIETHIDEVNRLWLAVQPLIIEFFDALNEGEGVLWV